MTEANEKKNQSVVYSFEGRWEQPLRNGAIRVFFRKRRPVILPRRVFLYVGVPVKAIIGFAKVESIIEVTCDQAIAIRLEGSIAENEIVKYMGNQGKVHAVRIGNPIFFEMPFELRDLKQAHGFNPPQSFSIVDANFECALLRKVK